MLGVARSGVLTLVNIARDISHPRHGTGFATGAGTRLQGTGQSAIRH
jgi:hypothetical protein